MNESKSPQKKNDLKQFIKNNYADLIGSGISGTLSLFSAVDPFVGFLAGNIQWSNHCWLYEHTTQQDDYLWNR